MPLEKSRSYTYSPSRGRRCKWALTKSLMESGLAARHGFFENYTSSEWWLLDGRWLAEACSNATTLTFFTGCASWHWFRTSILIFKTHRESLKRSALNAEDSWEVCSRLAQITYTAASRCSLTPRLMAVLSRHGSAPSRPMTARPKSDGNKLIACGTTLSGLYCLARLMGILSGRRIGHSAAMT